MTDLFPDEALSTNALLGGRLQIRQPRKGFRATSDALLLAAAVPARSGDPVLELGVGTGAAILALATRVPGIRAAGLELDPAHAELARRNAAANAIALDVHVGDVADMPRELRQRQFAHVLANPPYFAGGRGTPPMNEGRRAARYESAPLQDWVQAAGRRLRPGGILTIILPTERLAQLLAAATSRFGAIEIKPLQPRVGRPAPRFIARMRKGARGPIVLHAPLVLHAGPRHERDGDSYTPEATAILRDAAPLVFDPGAAPAPRPPTRPLGG